MWRKYAQKQTHNKGQDWRQPENCFKKINGKNRMGDHLGDNDCKT